MGAELRIPDLPSEEEMELARETGRKIAAIRGRGNKAHLCVHDGDDEFLIPMAALKILEAILNQMAQGNAFSVLPVGYMLTTQQAADLLNVSRPYLVKLLENGEIAFTKAGRHRRIKHADLVAYMRKLDEEAKKAVDSLAKEGQKLDMGY